MSQLDHCFALFKNRQFEEALAAARQLSTHFAHHAPLMVVQGVSLLHLQRPAEAIPILQRAVKLNSSDSNIPINLAIAYGMTGDVNAGAELFDQLLTKFPAQPALMEQAIGFASQYGLRNLQLEWSEKAHHLWPDNAAITYRYVLALKDSGQPEKALTMIKQLLNHFPENLSYLHEKAVLLRLSGAPEVAIPLLEKLRTRRTHFAIEHNLGNAYSDLGRLQEAIRQYETAISLNPDYIDSHVNLNHLLWETGQKDRFGDSFRRHLPKAGNLAQFLTAFGHLLIESKGYDEFESLWNTYCGQGNPPQELSLLRARGLSLAGKFAEAEECYRRLAQERTFNPAQLIDRAINQVELRRFLDAQSLLNQALSQESDNQIAKAYLDICLKQLNDPRLLNSHNIVAKQLLADLSPLQRNEYLQELAVHIKVLHRSNTQPVNQSLQNGTQTRGHLFSLEDDLIQAVKILIDQQVLALARSPLFAESKLIREDGTPNYVGSWSVCLSGPEAHHNNHFHSKGRISGVLYLKLPEVVRDTQRKQGWIKFGEPYLLNGDGIPPELFVQPEPGKLVLFPSYYWHGTTPIGSQEERITIAFDVGPVSH